MTQPLQYRGVRAKVVSNLSTKWQSCARRAQCDAHENGIEGKQLKGSRCCLAVRVASVALPCPHCPRDFQEWPAQLSHVHTVPGTFRSGQHSSLMSTLSQGLSGVASTALSCPHCPMDFQEWPAQLSHVHTVPGTFRSVQHSSLMSTLSQGLSGVTSTALSCPHCPMDFQEWPCSVALSCPQCPRDFQEWQVQLSHVHTVPGTFRSGHAV